MNQFENALADYDRAIQLLTGYVDAHHNRGISLVDVGRMDEAPDEFDEVICLQPEYMKAYLVRGVVHQRLNQLEDPLRDFSRALDLETRQFENMDAVIVSD